MHAAHINASLNAGAVGVVDGVAHGAVQRIGFYAPPGRRSAPVGEETAQESPFRQPTGSDRNG